MFVVMSGDSLRYVSIVRLLKPRMDGEDTLVTSGGRLGEVRLSPPLTVATRLEDILPSTVNRRDGDVCSGCEESECCEGDTERGPKPNDGLFRLKRLLMLDSVLCSRGDPFIDPDETDNRLSGKSSCPNDC